MKKVFAFLLCVLVLSCDDGDFDTPAFNFDETVYGCDVINNEHVLFTLANSEALIVTLKTSELKNEVGVVEVLINEDNTIYRTFSSDVTSSYFCQSVPPTEPEILSNWLGVSGSTNKIIIDTQEELDENDVLIGYRHYISFENLKLENGSNFIVYETWTFGEYVTSL